STRGARSLGAARGRRGSRRGGPLFRASRRGSENHVPIGGTHTEATSVVFEVMSHVELAEALPEATLRPMVMQSEMHHVVREITDVETCTDARAEVQPERG